MLLKLQEKKVDVLVDSYQLVYKVYCVIELARKKHNRARLTLCTHHSLGHEQKVTAYYLSQIFNTDSIVTYKAWGLIVSKSFFYTFEMTVVKVVYV